MKQTNWILCAAALAALLTQSQARAQDQKAPAAPPPGPGVMSSPVMIAGYGSWGSSCCTTPCQTGCCNECCDKPCMGGPVVAVEFPILAPFFKTPTYQSTFGDPTTPTRVVPDMPVELSERFTLGYANSNGLGARVRYWFWHGEGNKSYVIPAPSPTLGEEITPTDGTYQDRLELQTDTLDLEAFKESRVGNTTFTFSGGVRYGNVDTKYHRGAFTHFTNNTNGPVFASDGIDQKVNFYGWGPTVSMEISHPVRNSGLRLFAGGRASVLFGDTNVYFFDAAPIVTQGRGQDQIEESGAATSLRGRQTDMVVPVFELQVGAEYTREFRSMEAFFRVALEAQYWMNVTDGSIQSSVEAYGFNPFEMDQFKVRDSLGFVGVTLGFGIRR
ncbi:hypothetical protein AYO44_09705 [Planctomycetaceae bacterium SCGC AG-212-F19]|nr:hypothetical protein AYO44_09705 [Planctomycetaceae bacterium SCGC AG-212-F19]